MFAGVASWAAVTIPALALTTLQFVAVTVPVAVLMTVTVSLVSKAVTVAVAVLVPVPVCFVTWRPAPTTTCPVATDVPDAVPLAL
jgi:hypothetical protein